MTRPFHLLWVAVLWASMAGCTCGGLPAGGACKQASDCRSMVCGSDGRCIGDGTGGGSGAGKGGGSGAGNGGSGASGGGSQTLPDGGPCQNLQCRIPACPAGTTTTLTGKVYDPAGNVPLYNATVFVPNKPVDALMAGPSCSSCGALISGAPVSITLTRADGSFTLTDVPAGADIPLVVQIGKWRRQVTLANVTACQANALDAANTRLPRDHTEGDLPLIAIATGNADAFQCLLRKIGISDSEITAPNLGGRVHFYRQNGMQLPMNAAPAASTLWDNASTLNNYDVVILPCEGRENVKSQLAVRNMVNYANGGGRIFATHFSYVWTRGGWPQSAGYDPGLDDLYDQVFDVTVDRSFPKGQAFAEWLNNVGASTTLGTLPIRESRHDVVSVGLGSTRWLYGDVPAATPPASIQHFTFNTPYLDAGVLRDGGSAPQCGRAVFSDFHVTAGATDGGGPFPSACVNTPLSGQEKALEFMLFDLSACVQDDSTVPSVCGASGAGCTSDSSCCTGLTCLNSSGSACTGSGCTCTIGIQ